MPTKYLIVTLPVQSAAGDSEASLWRRLQESISRNSLDTPLYRFTLPRFRGTTFNSLIALSDELVRSNVLIEGLALKIRKQIEDLERDRDAGSGTLAVDGVPVDSYLSRFVWDEDKYPVKPPLKEIVASILSRVRKIEDRLKVQAADYNSVKNKLKSITRKQSISLVTRDLSNLVKPEDIITSEHLTTLLAVVPKYSQQNWLSSYEFFDTFVVPRSSKRLYEDNEYALYTVTLFAKVVDNFKVCAREKGFLIRDFAYSPEAQESKKDELEKLRQDEDAMRTSLLQFLYASYSEVFSSWMHFSAVFLFAESILRYGLSTPFLCAVLAPSPKSEKNLSSILEELCGFANSKYWKSEDGDLGDESHPYVSSTINVV
ncbi:V-type proton ATPase subunit C-like [Lolium rigidum]|uniref:V-type proton ATPase subunit C-like n=1 Tax=Lolium rigidum TaxID=89674 RepID=UPI001F5DC82C|nr:V-type proton ATPase subunit C-like [Lolium rigidum]